MRIILKNLKQKEYEIQIESNSITVKELKKEIEKLYSFDSEQIKLLSGGMILDNEKPLLEYKIGENSTVIMMNTKIKQFSNQDTNIPNNDSNINDNNKIQIQNDSKQNNNISEILKDNLKIQIDSLVDMGFEKSQVEIAVKAANGRIDLAIEYLNNGIPDNTNVNLNNNLRNNNRNNNNQNEIKRELKKQAGIIKVLCKDYKYRIFPILENIKRNDPGLFRLLTDYRDEFEKLLDTPITEEDEQYYKSLETKADEIINKRREEKEKAKKEKEEKKDNENKKEENKDKTEDKTEDKNNNEMNDIKNKDEEKKDLTEPKLNQNEENKQEEKKENKDKKDNNDNQNQNQLTDEDNQIIERLKKLGDFSHEKVVEAYIVCNKNEELTANYLFEQYN